MLEVVKIESIKFHSDKEYLCEIENYCFVTLILSVLSTS